MVAARLAARTSRSNDAGPKGHFSPPNADEKKAGQLRDLTSSYSVVELPGIEPVSEMALNSANAGFAYAKVRETTRNDLRKRRTADALMASTARRNRCRVAKTMLSR